MFRSAVTVLSVLTFACSSVVPPEASPAELRSALTVENGGNLNGGNLNGGNLNGGNLNGGNLNGTDLSAFLVSIRYSGAQLASGMELDRTEIIAAELVGYKNHHTYRGDDFDHAQFFGDRGDGATVLLRITDRTFASAPNSDIPLYWVEFRASDNAWYPACRDHTGAPVYAMAVKGRWDYRIGEPGGGAKIDDPTRFTFACMGGAIAKCALWGYRPWSTYQGESLAPFHQACTRLVRADYCGDGQTHTTNGQQINLYDRLGIQEDTEEWYFEAAWDEGGARCFYALNRSHEGLPCYDDRVDLLCSSSSEDRGLYFFNETPGNNILD